MADTDSLVAAAAAASAAGKPPFAMADAGHAWRVFSLSSLSSLLLATAVCAVALYLVLRRRRKLLPMREPLTRLDDTADLLIHGADGSRLDAKLPGELMAFLASIKYIGSFEEPVYLELVKHTQTQTLAPGEVVLRTGEVDQCLYLVVKGKVNVYLTNDRKEEQLVNVVTAGGSVTPLFNMLSVLIGQQPQPLMVSASAAEETELVKLPLDIFRSLAERYPASSVQMVQVLMTRFQRMTFYTLNRYFGLTKELLKVEDARRDSRMSKAFDDMSEADMLVYACRQLSEYLGLHPRAAPSTPKADAATLAASHATANGAAPSASGTLSGPATAPADAAAHGAAPSTPQPSTPATAAAASASSTYLSAAALPWLTPSSLLSSSAAAVSPSAVSRDGENILQDNVVLEEAEAGAVLLMPHQRPKGLYFVIEGKLRISIAGPNNSRTPLQEVGPGGVAGFLTVLAGYPLFMEISAATDTHYAFLPKETFDRIVDLFPYVWFALAKRWSSLLSPLVRQVDYALDWVHTDAGQVLYRAGERNDAIHLVLNGRLRMINQGDAKKPSESLGEYGRGEAVGDLELLTDMPQPGTVYAVRDTELARIPLHLLNVLSSQFPQVTVHVARHIANRVKERTSVGQGQVKHREIRTVALLPSDPATPMEFFATALHAALQRHGPAKLLTSAGVTHALGKNAFNAVGELKLLAYLEEQEEHHHIVLYLVDHANSPWMHRCVRQADLILVVGIASGDGDIGEYEQCLLQNVKTTARKELVLLHPSALVPTGTTHRWLAKRPWVHSHHHIQWQLPLNNRRTPSVSNASIFGKLNAAEMATLDDVGTTDARDQARSDLPRLARHLIGESVGVVLGGGGARGLAHIGVLKALEEANIPVDLIGGTSMGAFIGGLYARDRDHMAVLSWAMRFCAAMSSYWRQALDLTYPVTAWFTGRAFNRIISRCLGETHLIEDSWLSYFAVTVNLTKSRLDVHRSGIAWRYIRASMSLTGFLPPLCDDGQMLVDGGYLNNLPADVMRAHSGAKHIIAVDVGRSDEIEDMDYGDSVSGWYVLWRSILPFGKPLRVPTLAEIQSRLAYVASVSQLDMVKELPGCIYMRPPVEAYETLDFHRAAEIVEVGYQYARECIEEWRAEGRLADILGKDDDGGGQRKLAGPVGSTTDLAGMRHRASTRVERLSRRLSF